MKKIRNMVVYLVVLSMVMAVAGCNNSKSRKTRDNDDSEETEIEEIEETEDIEETTTEPSEEVIEESIEESVEETSETTEISTGEVDLGFTQGLIEVVDANYAFTGTTPDMIDVSGGYRSVADYQGEDDSESKDRLFGEYYYNSNGDEVLFCRYGEDGDLVHSEYYEYDDQNRLITMEMWSRDSYQDSSFSAYEYNSDGNISLIHYGKASGYISSTTVFEYDDQGKLISETNTAPDGEHPNFKYEYIYNDDGSYKKCYLGWNSFENELMNNSENYTLYDANGLEIEFYPGSMENKYVYYSYDENGRMIEYQDYKGKTLKGYTVYTYDENGRLLQSDRYFSSGNINYSLVFSIEDM